MNNVLIRSGDQFIYKIYGGISVNRLVDNKEMIPSFCNGWYTATTEPKEYTDIHTSKTQTGWTLKEEYAETGLEKSRGKDYFVYDDDSGYPPEVALYDAVYEVNVERETHTIEWDKIFDEHIESPALFMGVKGGFSSGVVEIVPVPSATHAALFPDIMLPSKPAALSSEQLYAIVRSYIRDNINPKYAKITSDYDFCFTVKKRLEIPPEKRAYDANVLKRTNRVKLVKYTVNDREVTVFEMTSAEKNYKGYTIINGITAANHKELKEKVTSILERLIKIINEPVKSCTACKGTGAVLVDKVTINEENK